MIQQARIALEEATPRLVFLGSPAEIDAHRRDGVVAVPITCHSEGAMEIYVEPVLPPPHLVVIGRTPAVDALARMGSALGWRTAVIDDRGSAADHPGIESVQTSLDVLDSAGVTERSFVVVATQGHYDEDAVERALRTPASYVGLVASRKRADAVTAYLRERGVGDEDLDRIRAPAGLDLGRVRPQEIAVAVLAELVQLRAAGEIAAGVQPREAAPSEIHEATDPVCGMTVAVATARHLGVHEGRTYYFCSPGCTSAFERDPAAYLDAAAEESP
jgi:xanthine dehydrogenase accessory factor